MTAPMAPVPVVWSLLGYQFEAGAMIAGLCACLAVRLYVAMASGKHWWKIDVPVTALVLLLTMASIIKFRPEPIYAIIWGCGLGAMGAGVIAICMTFVRRSMAVLAATEGADAASTEATARLWGGALQRVPEDMTATVKRLDPPANP